MVIFFAALLGISIVGIMSLIAVKRYELNTGRVVLARVRPSMGEFLGSGLYFIEHDVPRLIVGLVKLGWAWVKHFTHRAVAWIILHTERRLESTLQSIRHTTHIRGDGEASHFLREVALHKKSLSESTEQRAIYEE